MKNLLTLALVSLACGGAFAYPAVEGLIGRLLPQHKNQIVLQDGRPLSEKGTDTFAISTDTQGRLVLSASSPVAQASALGWYLRYTAGCDVGWEGVQLNLPEKLPAVKEPVEKNTLYKFRPYFNYCTLSYTGAFWDWERWEREIDIMALNGINMPLSATGLEGVWYNMLQKFGFSELEAREFLVGPAFFAWQWMTNIENFAGPLPKSWIESHITLGQQIMTRQREFGMTPIQQGFTGFVPIKMMEKFPDAAIKQQPPWCGAFKGSAQLDPMDPLFPKLAKAFYEEQKRLFGDYGYYGTDPFHESAPPQNGNRYLADVGKVIYEAAIAANPDAVLCMQSWSLRMPILQAVPKEHALVLDIGGKWRGVKGFDGYPFVVGTIHNFGGRTRMFGDLNGLAKNSFLKTMKDAPNCVGMGLFPEAIHNNPAYFGMVFDFIWRDEAVSGEQWVKDYAARRYGIKDPAVDKAWELLLKSVYRPGTYRGSSLICASPCLNVRQADPNDGFRINYNPLHALEAWNSLLSVSEKVKNAPGYGFDVADVGRQVMGDMMLALHCDVINAYLDNDLLKYQIAVRAFHDFAMEFDALMATQPLFSFETWAGNARKWGTTEAEKDLYAFNAAMQVTQWGFTYNRPRIYDYAWKEWSGLIRHYYVPRWEIFHRELEKALKDGKPWPDEDKNKIKDWGRTGYRTTPFMNQLADFEDAWIRQSHRYRPYAPRDTAEVSREILGRWGDKMVEKMTENPIQQIGKVRARIADRDANPDDGKMVFRWAPKDCSKEWKTWTIDATAVFVENGTYEVTFTYTGGGARLDIAEVVLLQNDQEIARDAHEGTTGDVNKANVYRLRHDDPIIGAKFALKAKVKTHGTTNSNGTVQVKLVK